MIAWLLLGPLALALAARLLPAPPIVAALPAVWGLLGLGLSLRLAANPETTAYFTVDGPAALLLVVLHAVFLVAALGHYDAARREAGHGHDDRLARQTALMLIFCSAMAGVPLANHLALLWVFVEATTLASAPLIYAERGRTSLEAAWKYVFICSIGIAFAFVGVLFVSMAGGPLRSLFLADLEAGARAMNPFWLRVALPFLLVGFGTKAGLAPVHAWLPDAHSEAPAPVSALLSGALLATALLAILRVGRIMHRAGLGPDFARILFLMGFLSLLVAAVYILRTPNYKRLLAYSSIEHIGIIAIGLAAGGAATFAALLHLSAHALGKAAFFVTAGNLLAEHGTKQIAGVSGVVARRPLLGWTWVACFFALGGLPPFPIFASELLLARALIGQAAWGSLALFGLLITVALIGTGRAVLATAFGPPAKAVGRVGFAAVLAPLLALAALAACGLALPAPLAGLLARAAEGF